MLSQTNLILEDNIAVKSDKELYLASSTYSAFGSGGSYYSGFVTDPQVEPDLTISPLGVCISSSGVSNVELKTSNSFDTYKWEIEDDSTTPSTWIDAPTDPSDPLSTNNGANYKPIIEGDYRLVGTLSCYIGRQYISETQIVSICPTDFDGDGIVDNLDLDLDNDGILNSIESSGNVKIDLSSISSPILMFPTVSFTTSATYTATTSSTFIGDSDGNFKSEIVASGLNETAIYNFDPVQYDSNYTPAEQRVNILFSEDSSVTHTYNADEEFSIRAITDIDDKNFTVIDPGEKLLVKQAGAWVTIPPDGFSGRKIIFKYNDNPLDPTLNFSFYAYDVEGFEFTHNVSPVASVDSSFSGKLELLDYILDSDSDGDLDMYDFDSDGDGCNDIVEGDVNFSNITIRPRIDLDPNDDGIYGDLTYGSSGDKVIQFPDVDSRGRIIDLIDATSGTYKDPPLDPSSSIPVYLETNAPSVVFSAGGQPEDYQVCEIGQDAEFKVTVDSGGYTPFYQWQVDIQDGNGWKNLLDDPATTPLTIDANLEIKSVTAAMDGWEYRVLTWSDGAFCYSISDPAVLKVEATLPTANAVDLTLIDENWIIKCDDDYDGKATFDLTLIDDYIRGPLQSSTDFEVSYFLNATDAASPTTTGITTPSAFTNTPNATYDPNNPSTQTLELHVRVRNINSNCLADPMSFELTINTVPLLVAIPDFEQCNNTVFDLVALQPSLSINAATETFEFFDSSGTLIASPSNYQLPDPNTNNEENISVKVKNSPTLGSGCSQQTTFVIRLGACDIPSTFPVLPVAVCETSTDPLGGGQDGFETFDKSIFSNIEAALIAEEPLFDIFGTEINFFRSDADAQAGVSTTAIDKTVDYTTSAGQGFELNTTENRWEQELWIRVENTTVSTTPLCFDTKKVATLYINKLPELINNSLPFEQCNNTVFDLVALQPSLSINAATETFEFFDSSGTLIASPSSYTFTGSSTSNQETISVTISSRPSLGTACNISANIMLKLGACDIPSTFPVLPVAVCETSTDPLGGGQDGFETFDKSIFSNIEAALIAEEPLFDIFGTEINFFRSDADAQAGVSTTAIDKTVDYTTSAGQGFELNTTENRWEQELWIRVENTTVSTTPLCFDTKKVATLYINKLPELLRSFVPFNQCNLGIFNLTTKERELSSNYADEVFEYYDSTGTLITDPANYTAAGLNEIITVTINTTPSIGTACINTTASINLAWSVTTLPSAYTLIDEYLIETDPDLKGQGQDGIETFDKSIFDTVQADLIVAEPAFSGKTFSFYRSQNDALRTKDKIDTTIDFATDKQTNAGFTFNTAENRWEQQIWVYIEDNVTSAISTCYGLYHIATVYVEKRPVFYDVTVKERCDEQTPLDMYSLFDTSSLFSEFTRDPTGSVAQNTSLFTVEYTYVDDTGAAVTLDPTLPSNFNTTDQTITITLTNNSTNTTLPAGVSSGTIEFKVYQQPIAYPSDPSVAGVYTFEECDDDNDGLALGEEVFDMSTIKTDLLTDISGTYPAQDPGDFDFEFSVAGSPITLGSDYTAITGDQIEVTITNPLFTSCEETITIDFVVNPLPSFDIDDPTVICLNLTQPVEIGTSNWNGAADPSIYTYSWTLDSDPSFSETTETIFPDKGGIYTVVAEDPITFCTQTKSITVTESEIASIDLDKDGDVTDSEYDHFIEVLDLTNDNTNTITINNVTDLGIGDYEFSLDDAFGPYQDDPVFTDVPPGVHTVYIRDKNSYYTYDYGCGIAEIKVSIIGYKKYFTPNGDGINEKWKILGINFDFNKDSKVYIFDRYGKLLKQLDPLSEGWDGTYIGKPMPATDYWFRTYLEDGREFKGHFSLVRLNK